MHRQSLFELCAPKTHHIYNSLPPHAEQTESELVEVRRERDRLRKQKEEEVSALNSRLQAMEKSYDAILQVMIL